MRHGSRSRPPTTGCGSCLAVIAARPATALLEPSCPRRGQAGVARSGPDVAGYFIYHNAYEVLVVISPLVPKTAPILTLRAPRRQDGPPRVPSASGRCLRTPGAGLASGVGGRRGLVRLEDFGARRSAVKSGW